MELQGSNIFSSSNKEQFPPAFDRQITSNNLEPQRNVNFQSDPGSFNSTYQSQLASGGYQTQDIFGGNTNPFIETLRALALNPSQINHLLSNLPATATPSLQIPPRYIF